MISFAERQLTWGCLGRSRLHRLPVITSAMLMLQCTIPRWAPATSAQDPDNGQGSTDCMDVKGNLSSCENGPDVHLQKTDENWDKHQCRFCAYFSRSPANVAIHERTHTGEKPFICRFCRRGFAIKKTLLNHERTHTGEKPFECQFCQLAFAQRISLVHHERIHTGERPFMCNMCGSEFARKSSLVDHERTHVGERRYRCETCGRTFRQRGTLKRHQKSHDRLPVT